jgi:hypothetical protein
MFRLDLSFVLAVRTLPPGLLPGVLGWLRGWRRRQQRVFWVMDVVDGGWREV